jgi:peptidoglycan/xylan/chitin deacetylase (PgdA/CDA1 family)
VLRRLAKTGMAWGLRGTGMDRLLGLASGRARSPLVVGYHRVVESFEASARGALPGMIISRRMLEHQLDWLGRRFRFVSLGELGAKLEAREGFSSPVAAVTFDDGYADVYEHALPLLRRKGIPAAVFVVTDIVGSGGLHLYDRLHVLLSRVFSRSRSANADVTRLVADLDLPLPESVAREGLPSNAFSALRLLLEGLPRAGLVRVASALEFHSPIDESAFPELRPMSWEMVREMHRGGTTIGSHTRSHAVLTREDPSQVHEEAAASRRDLERHLGAAVEHFAYPDGGFDDVAVAAVAQAGYRFAYTTCASRDPRRPLLTIPRRMLWETSCLGVAGRFSGAVMSCQAAGVFDRLVPCGHDHRPRRPLGTGTSTSEAAP